jgi:hypothetical protein
MNAPKIGWALRPTRKDKEMRRAHPLLTLSIRATLTFFVAFVVGATALLSFGTRPAETQQTSAEQRYVVKDLGTLGGVFQHCLRH